MAQIADFMRLHPVISALIILVVVVVVLPPLVQSPFWIWRLFFRRNYYGWLLRRKWLVERIGGSVLLWLTFGDPEQAPQHLARQPSAAVEDVLVGILTTGSRPVYDAACQALADIGSVRAVPELLRQVRQGGHWDGPAGRALQKLAQANPDVPQMLGASLNGAPEDAPVIALLARLGDLDRILDALPVLAAPGARVAAARSLAESTNPRVAPALMALDTEGNEQLVIAIATTLGQVGGPECVEYLVAALAHASTSARPAIAAALGRLGDGRAVAPVIQAMLDDPANAPVYARALAGLGDARALAPLTALLACAEKHTVAILAAIQRIGGSAAVSQAIAMHWSRAAYDRLRGTIVTGFARAAEDATVIEVRAVRDILEEICDRYVPMPQAAASAATGDTGGGNGEIDRKGTVTLIEQLGTS